jgi:hypothetical protein
VIDALTSAPLQYAKVCLHKANDIFQVGSTDANGQVTFSIRPRTTGEIKVTVTRPHDADNNYNQYLPSQTICRVLDDRGGGCQSSGSGEMVPVALCITEMPTISSNNCVIKFGVPHKKDITISVYDATGSRVELVKRKNIPEGYYQERLDTKAFANGIYFLVLKQGNDMVNRKFLVIR